jgi:hypothetical protein
MKNTAKIVYYDEVYKDDMCNDCFNDMETCSKIELDKTFN